MTAPLHRALALSALCGALACVGEQAPVSLPELDAGRYDSEVQPFVAASCASLDCHGVRGRPLRLYSELGLRRDDALRLRAVSEASEPEPLSSAELADNIEAFAALVPALSPGDEWLALSKPLAQAAGGGEHVGGDLFADRDHPGYRCLERWLKGSDRHPDSCFEALDRLSAP